MCVCARRCTSLATCHLELFSKTATAAMAMTRKDDDEEEEESVTNYRSTSVRKQTRVSSCLQDGACEWGNKSDSRSQSNETNRIEVNRIALISRRYSRGSSRSGRERKILELVLSLLFGPLDGFFVMRKAEEHGRDFSNLDIINIPKKRSTWKKFSCLN